MCSIIAVFIASFFAWLIVDEIYNSPYSAWSRQFVGQAVIICVGSIALTYLVGALV